MATKFFFAGEHFIAGHSEHIKWIAVDHRLVVSLQSNSVWSPFYALPACEGTIFCLAVIPVNDAHVVVAGTSVGVEVFDIETLDAKLVVTSHESVSTYPVHFVSFVTFKKVLAVHHDGSVNVFDVRQRNSVQGSTSWLASVKHLFRSVPKFISAAHDKARHHCLVLTDQALELWTTLQPPTKKAFFRTPPGAVAVHCSDKNEEHLAVVLFATGKQCFYKSASVSNGGAIQLVLAFERGLSDLALRDVRLSATQGSTTALFDATSKCLVVEASGLPFFGSVRERCDVVSIIAVPARVVSLSVYPVGPSDEEVMIVAHGERGPVLEIRRLSFAQLLKGSLTVGGDEVLDNAVQCLGGESVARSLLEGGIDNQNRPAVAWAINKLMLPRAGSLNEATFSFVTSAVLRAIQESIHSVSYFMKTVADDEIASCMARHSGFLARLIATLRGVLSSEGWLDTTHTGCLPALRWKGLCVHSDDAGMTMQVACAAQAVFVSNLLEGASFLSTVCALYGLAYRHGIELPRINANLMRSTWSSERRHEHLKESGISFVERATLQAIQDFETQLDCFPPIVRVFVLVRQSSASLLMKAVADNIRVLSLEGCVLRCAAMISCLFAEVRHSSYNVATLWAQHDPTAPEALAHAFEYLESCDEETLLELLPSVNRMPAPDVLRWLVSHRITDGRCAALLQWFEALWRRSPTAVETLIVSSAVGKFYYANICQKTNKISAAELFLETAFADATLSIEERLVALQMAHSCNATSGSETAMKVARLQIELMQRLSCVETDPRAHSALETLRTTFVTEEALFAIAEAWADSAAVCGAEIMLELLLQSSRKHQLVHHIAATVDMLLHTFGAANETQSPLDVCCAFADKFAPRLPAEVPLASIMIRFVAQNGSQNCVAGCERLIDHGVDCVSMLSTLSELLQGSELLGASIENVVPVMLAVLLSAKLDADNRVQFLEVLTSHVMYVLASHRDEVQWCDASRASCDACLLQMQQRYPDVTQWISPLRETLRGIA